MIDRRQVKSTIYPNARYNVEHLKINEDDNLQVNATYSFEENVNLYTCYTSLNKLST